MIGWANLSWKGGALDAAFGFVKERPAEPAFERALEAELAHMKLFLSGSSADE